MTSTITELLKHIARYSAEIRKGYGLRENTDIETLRDTAFDLSTAASELFLETLTP
jgi:hypothetical protein